MGPNRTRNANDGGTAKGTSSQKGINDDNDDKNKNPDLNMSLSNQTCDVCYDFLQYPVNLPCSHTFCFLCIKGAYFNNKLCPMCRSPIPDHIIKRPQVQQSTNKKSQTINSSSSSSVQPNHLYTNNKVYWCYESRREQKTWWKYDNRTSIALEELYQKYLTDIDQTFHDLQIAGEIYEIDFSTKRQYRKNHTGKKRLIIRSSELGPADVIVGTAGIKSIK